MVALQARALGYADDVAVAAAQRHLAECERLLAQPSPDYAAAYAACELVETQTYGAGAVPFIYDVREQSDTFGKWTTVMERYLNMPGTRAALNVGERRWVQMDGLAIVGIHSAAALSLAALHATPRRPWSPCRLTSAACRACPQVVCRATRSRITCGATRSWTRRT
jgi:hypothetical protein